MKFSQTYSAKRHSFSEGFHAYSYPVHWGTNLSDPVLSVDHFFMKEAFFPPHPHAGFSAVTYMLPKSRGSFVNRDSRGDQSIISPGDLHWTLAGSGVIHEEVPQVPGVECEGLQIFFNLPAEHKFHPPRSFHVTAASMPIGKSTRGSALRVVLGEAGGLSSKIDLPTAVGVFHLSLLAGDEMGFPVLSGQGGVVVCLSGSGVFSYEGESRLLHEHQIVAFRSARSSVAPRLSGTGEWVVILGAYRDEPVVAHGPFIMNTEDQVRQALDAYRDGRMGRLESSFAD